MISNAIVAFSVAIAKFNHQSRCAQKSKNSDRNTRDKLCMHHIGKFL